MFLSRLFRWITTGYEDLYRRITNQPRVDVPKLGPRHALIPAKRMPPNEHQANVACRR